MNTRASPADERCLDSRDAAARVSITTAHYPHRDGHVALRPLSEEHLGLFVNLTTMPRVMRHIAPVLDERTAEVTFAKLLAEVRSAPPRRYVWAVRSRGDFVGIASLTDSVENADIGIMLLPEAWDRSTAHHCVEVMLRFAFECLGKDYVTADTRDGVNARAISRLVQPFGFEEAPPTPGRQAWRLARPAWQARSEVAPSRQCG